MKQRFDTSVGTVEVLVDERSKIVSAYRFDADGRPVAAALESLEHIDLVDVLADATGVTAAEAMEIATAVYEESGLSEEERAAEPEPPPEPRATRAEIWATALAAFAALFLAAVVLWMLLHPVG
jgi:hypothetical protein